MTKAEEMAMKTVHDLGVAGDWDVCNYTGLSPVDAGWALDALYRKGYLKIVSTECECDANEHGEVINVGVFTLFELTPEGKEAAQGIPDINEPMCIPITNVTFERGSGTVSECKYHEDTDVTGFRHCCLIGKTVRYNDFCSYGERKDGDRNG